MKYTFSLFACLFIVFSDGFSQHSNRWALNTDGGIKWIVRGGTAHTDHIEMSGLQSSAIITYGVDSAGCLALQQEVVYPMLRTIPNNTHASLRIHFDDYRQLAIRVAGKDIIEYPDSFYLRGKLVIYSHTAQNIKVTRTLFPSADKAAIIELLALENAGKEDIAVSIQNNIPEQRTDAAKGVYGTYVAGGYSRDTAVVVSPGNTFTTGAAFAGRKLSDEPYAYSAGFELAKRERVVADVFKDLVLETPNDTINRAFAFAKLRTTESIYDTKGGLMHGPGGGAYYAAIWANDQAEYANPFFPFLDNAYGNESAINSYRMFARFINPGYKPIPSSIIAEGTDIWNGAGDRGDMAMIAYGASRFSLALGKRETAKELWPLITWCIEYLERQKTPDGVIKSDNDELEGRFPAGKINLSTNSLAYGGYISAAFLAEELGDNKTAATYRARAAALRTAIERYFGAAVQGFETYRYYDGNTKLRSWICLPLVMGITERKEQTIKALFSPYLWTSNGILTEAGSTTFWDRSTLYAFRGLLAAGATNECMPYLAYYSSTRLLGEHVPYPVEAWPEGGQRHLAAESALYCRAITEGLFGINPTGFKSFTLTPWLPKGWNIIKLNNIRAFGDTFNIVVRRTSKGTLVTLTTISGKQQQKNWDGKAPLAFVL